MQRIFPSNKKPFCLSFNVSSLIPTKVHIQAFDKNKPNCFYYSTAGVVNGDGLNFDLTFPISPDELVVRIFPERFKNYNDYIRYSNPAQRDIKVTDTKVSSLKTVPIWLSEKDREFIKFAQWFISNASILSATQAGNVPSVYKSEYGNFTIHYHNKIFDRKTNAYVSTPARIGHDSGIIDVSKSDFNNFTVQGRMAILLHEYSHKFVNPREGLKISDEVGADINGLNMYLSLGYSPIEAHLVFLDVFETANNDMNKKRYLILTDFIKKFVNGQLKQYCRSVN